MNVDRRRGNLEKRIQGIEEEIERQQKAKQGVQSLSKVYQETPDFCDEKGHDDVSRQLVEVGVWSGRVCALYPGLPHPRTGA